MNAKLQGSESDVLFERDGRVARIILNAPDRLNALSVAMMKQISRKLAEWEEDDGVHVVVIKGNGRAFCTGMLLEEIAEQHHGKDAHNDRRETFKLGFWFQRNLWEFSKPTILQLHGYCYAGAGYFLSFTDLVVAAEDTMIGAPENRGFGLEPSLGMWPLTIGMRWTKALVLTGDAIDARTAERIGMITKAVPADELESYVDWLAKKVARTDLHLLSLHKQTVNMIYDIIGFYPMLKAGMVFDHMEHMDSMFYEVLGRAKKEGAKKAFAWVYGQLGGAQKQGDPSFLDGPPKKKVGTAAR
jgi:enoyl-CoA hydratase